MSLKGNLESFFLSSILQLLQNDKKTGILLVKNAADEAQLILQEGEIIYAMSNHKEARLGNIVLNKGIITRDQLEICLNEGKQKKQALGKILVEKGLINLDQLKRLIQIQVEEILYLILSWEFGEFDYKDVTVDLSGLIVTQVDITSIILEAARRKDEMTELKFHIPHNGVIFKVVSDSDISSEIKPGTIEWNILSLLDGKRNTGDIIELSGLGRYEVYKILISLISMKIIQRKEESLAEFPPERTDDSDLISLYNRILHIIWLNLESEIGKETTALFKDCKPDTLPGQPDPLKNFIPNRLISVTPGLQSQFIDIINRFLLNLLNRIPDVLAVLPTMKILEEIESVLPAISQFSAQLNFKNTIIDDVKKIVDRVAQEIVEREKRKDKPARIVSILKQKQ